MPNTMQTYISYTGLGQLCQPCSAPTLQTPWGERWSIFKDPLYLLDHSEFMMEASTTYWLTATCNHFHFSFLLCITYSSFIPPDRQRCRKGRKLLWENISSFSRNSAVNSRTKWGMECSFAPGRMTLSVAQTAKCMETSVPCVQVCCEYPPFSFLLMSSSLIFPESEFPKQCVEYILWVICWATFKAHRQDMR